jgi:hypothetical protein
VVIPAEYNGPPSSGHGGYAAGLTASAIAGPAEVTLRRPPPLERPLRLQWDDLGNTTLYDGEHVVATARPIEAVDAELPEPVGLAEALDASERWAWRERHPFPTCYACGPKRHHGEGLRQFLGPLDGRADTFASPFMPPLELTDDDAMLDEHGLWTSLDCPTGAAIAARPIDGPAVLARLSVQRLGPVDAVEPHVAVARFLAEDGRKRHTMAAIFDADGNPCGVSRALWIALTPEQAASMTSQQ